LVLRERERERKRERERERERERNHKEVMKIFNSNLVKGVKEWFEIIKKPFSS
jgi:hypothetical protein